MGRHYLPTNRPREDNRPSFISRQQIMPRFICQIAVNIWATAEGAAARSRTQSWWRQWSTLRDAARVARLRPLRRDRGGATDPAASVSSTGLCRARRLPDTDRYSGGVPAFTSASKAHNTSNAPPQNDKNSERKEETPGKGERPPLCELMLPMPFLVCDTGEQE